MKIVIDIDIEDWKDINDIHFIREDLKLKIGRAIMNGTPLDKIRAEIEQLTYYWCEVNPRSVIDDVLQIIDKYKESEE